MADSILLQFSQYLFILHFSCKVRNRIARKTVNRTPITSKLPSFLPLILVTGVLINTPAAPTLLKLYEQCLLQVTKSPAEARVGLA